MDRRLLLLVACFAFIYACNAAYTNRVVVTFPQDVANRIRAEIKKCIANKADIPDLYKLVREGRYKEDEDFKAFIHCVYKNCGYTFDNGRVKTELAASVYPDPALMLITMKKCDEERITPVETTFHFFKCFQENTPFLIGL